MHSKRVFSASQKDVRLAKMDSSLEAIVEASQTTASSQDLSLDDQLLRV